MSQGAQAMLAIHKARHTGEPQTISYETATGQERVAVIRWRGGAAHIYSMLADSATDHRVKILHRMTG
jgi:hypothetical protein